MLQFPFHKQGTCLCKYFKSKELEVLETATYFIKPSYVKVKGSGTEEYFVINFYSLCITSVILFLSLSVQDVQSDRL